MDKFIDITGTRTAVEGRVLNADLALPSDCNEPFFSILAPGPMNLAGFRSPRDPVPCKDLRRTWFSIN